MTDFTPESSLSGYASLVPHGLWNAEEEPPNPRPPTAAPQQSAASLAAAAQHLLDSMALRRVPRLDALRRQLQNAGTGPSLDHIDAALAELHEETAALDFLAGRSGERAPEFLQQCAALAASTVRLHLLGAAFAEHHSTQGPVSRLLWIELVLESAALQKRVRQGAHWLARMERELNARRKSVTAEVSQRALEELARRGRLLHERLQTVHRLCGHARSVHTLCEQLATQRSALCATLQDRLRVGGERLQHALQPLMQAAAYRQLVPEELMAAIEARHALQVVLTQARAEVGVLQHGAQELAAQLAWIEQKAQQRLS